MPPSAGHSWTCPACSRQVPARIDVCRCGRTREPAEAAPRDAGGARAALPPAVWLAGALVVVLALWVRVLGPDHDTRAGRLHVARSRSACGP